MHISSVVCLRVYYTTASICYRLVPSISGIIVEAMEISTKRFIALTASPPLSTLDILRFFIWIEFMSDFRAVDDVF